MAEPHPIDPSQDYLDNNTNPLDGFFKPSSVAVIGATEKENSVGRTVMLNLKNGGYSGKIYPVNPKRETIFEYACHSSVEAIEDHVDLAIIITPAKTVPNLVKACVDKGVPSIIIISAGFKELGEPGIKLEQEILQHIKGTKTRIIGPNCLGLMNTHMNLNATFAATMALKGRLGFISQSGAMCTSVLDWSLSEKIGFSAFISIGSMSDVSFGDLIDYLGQDPNTDMILIYMESIGQAKMFLSAARKVALTKPIILIKAGKTQAAAKAAASHTGSLAGSDDAFNAAVARAGVMRVDDIAELFDIAATLSKQPPPRGPNLTIVTNAGGPAVLATDKAVYDGAQMTELDQETINKLNEVLPDAWSHSNPVDILGDASAKTYADTIKILEEDANTDGMLVILTPQDMTEPTVTAKLLSSYSNPQIPLYASWMGGDSLEEGIEILQKADIPNFPYPDDACKNFAKLYKHQEALEALYETPALKEEVLSKEDYQKRKSETQNLLDKVFSENRAILDEYESKQILKFYGIPTVATEIANSPEEAVKYAEEIGYPSVLKLYSKTITHKSDVGGVKLHLKNKEEVKQAFIDIKTSVSELKGAEHFQGVTVQQMVTLSGYEILLGAHVDPQFGPVLVFGTGGQLVEIFKDSALAIPPLNSTLVKQLMQKTKIYHALTGTRGRPPVDFETLEKTIIAFSQLIVEHPMISELDINPLLVSENGVTALDARVIIHEKKDDIVGAAIAPYPNHLIDTITLSDNTHLTLRPIRPEDEAKIIDFHQLLSANSVRSRFFAFMSLEERTKHDRLIQICCIDYDREMRFVVEDEQERILAVAGFFRYPNTLDGEFRLIIADEIQGKGLGRKLLEKILHTAKEFGLKSLSAPILEENEALIGLCKKLGFAIEKSPQNQDLFKAHIAL